MNEGIAVETVPLDAVGIPAELKADPQWVGWRREWDPDANKGEGGWVKPAYTLGDRKAASTRSADWTTFEAAQRGLTKPGKPFDGVGRAITGDDVIIFVDLDHCRAPETGEIRPWADGQRDKWPAGTPEPAEIIERLDSYTEVSPSGTGVHIVLRGSKTHGDCKRADFECYDHARFLYMTGQRLEGTPAEVNDRTDELTKICEAFFGAANAGHQRPSAHQRQHAAFRRRRGAAERGRLF